MNTVKRIVNYQKTLRIPKEANLSKQAKDLIFRLICAPTKRLNYDKLKRHAWFKRVPWHNLQSMKPPWIPRTDRDDDTRYFEEVKNANDDLKKTNKDQKEEKKPAANSLGVAADPNHFQGFTFERPKKNKKNVDDLFGGQ